MKKTTLLSLAAAAALTFGASSTNAKAETVQQPVSYEKVIYVSPLQWNAEDQTAWAKMFASLYHTYTEWQSFNVPLETTQKPAQPTTTKPAQPTTTKPAQPTTATPAQPTTTKPAQPTTTTPAQPTTTKPAQPTTATPAQPTTTKPTQPAPAPSTGTLSAYEQKVVTLTNQERAKQGLPALQVDSALSKVAKAKSQDMYNANYFSHTSPTYGSPFDMMKQFGISYRTAGENIAMGQKTPEEVVQAWMNSAGHRANILNTTYTHIGVGYVAGKNIWTQQFISK
ncbi:CAP domain-containing protein [Ectobacillus funiculus]|uniref:CAP domain-containing protein n=1 Tax=Ectobacillus funiculus TaxID=137993 RepID=UPI00101DC919|nr:CAP domain-containing protein [Ectobacillus funiculus]